VPIKLFPKTGLAKNGFRDIYVRTILPLFFISWLVNQNQKIQKLQTVCHLKSMYGTLLPTVILRAYIYQKLSNTCNLKSVLQFENSVRI
jgi:hypothetical protein